MRTHISIDIDASPRRVFDLCRQVESWATLLPHYRSVTVVSHDGGERVVRMRAVRPVGRFGVPVGWRSRTWAEDMDPDDLRLRFFHTGGATRGMDVTWHIRPRPGGGCTATIEHDFTRRLPLVGSDVYPRIVDRWFVRPIAGRTLATFKRLAES